MDPGLPPKKRLASRNEAPPPPSPPPPLAAFVPQRRRTPYLTYRALLDDNGTMSDWRRYFIRPQNLGGYQELRVELYNAAGADDTGVSHNHQAVIYYLTRQDLLVNRNQAFRRVDARRNWNTFANTVQRFRIVWVPLNINSSKRPTDRGKKPSNGIARYSNARHFYMLRV